jgi:hypothetical protein
MFGPLRLIPAAALAAVFATHADAETHYLSTHGDWRVALEVTGGDMACAASTVNGLGEMLDLTIKSDAQATLYVIFDGKPGMKQIDLDVVIAGADRWELENLTLTQYGLFFNFPDAALALQFMIDVQNGLAFGLAHPRSAETFGDFSLDGSRGAIDGLFECFRRISGVGA